MGGKGAVKSERVSFHTLTIVQLSGVVVSIFHSFMCMQKMQNC